MSSMLIQKFVRRAGHAWSLGVPNLGLKLTLYRHGLQALLHNPKAGRGSPARSA